MGWIDLLLLMDKYLSSYIWKDFNHYIILNDLIIFNIKIVKCFFKKSDGITIYKLPN
jgi:hypothetical protein